MKLDWLKARQTKYTAYVSLYILVVVAILGAANWLANRYNKSYDSTANKRFSLSEQTTKVAKNLKKPVKILYFDKSSEFARARDLLDRYDNLSPKLTVEYVDTDKRPQFVRAMGVRTYGTTIVEAGEKREEAKSVTEEEVTGALIRALKSRERGVCFVSGSGEHSIDDSGRTGFSKTKEALEKNNYKARAISLFERPEVPKDCTVLIFGGPTKDYVAPEVAAIKSYVENGGRALFLLDPVLKMGHEVTADNVDLLALLQAWGVTLDNDLVLDTSGVGQLFGLGPEIPLVSNYESQPIVRDMKGTATVFPLVRSLDTKQGGKTMIEKLFATSENSFATVNLSSPSIEIDPKKDRRGPLTLAAAGSYNTGKQNEPGRFVVVGGSTWATNGFLPVHSVGNQDLFLNMMNWLSSDEDLISIRPKAPENRPLALTNAQVSRIFLSSVVGFPLIILLGGVAVWWKRR
jgi:ABC-type uncharacterized transport system involved in gliding motility auxiliary subunit